MSLDCRLFRKSGEDQIYYYCRNSGVTPTEISLWTDPAKTPKEIEHYFKNCNVTTIGPYMAAFFGIQKNCIRIFQNVIIQNTGVQAVLQNTASSHPVAHPVRTGPNAHIFQRKSERNSNS